MILLFSVCCIHSRICPGHILSVCPRTGGGDDHQCAEGAHNSWRSGSGTCPACAVQDAAAEGEPRHCTWQRVPAHAASRRHLQLKAFHGLHFHAGVMSCAHGQASSEQLRLGVAHLTSRLSRSRQFYADVAKLQHDWNIQVGRRSPCEQRLPLRLHLLEQSLAMRLCGLPSHSSVTQIATCHVQSAGGVYKGFAVDLSLLPADGAPPADSLVDLLQVSEVLSRLNGKQSTARALWLSCAALHRH